MKPQAQQSLFPFLPPARPQPRLVRAVPRRVQLLPRARRAPLWLAVWLPDLALETLLHLPSGARKPQAAIDSTGNVARVCAVNVAAADAGVESGMTLTAAWALLPQLAVHERDVARERRRLRALACRAMRYTPNVCLAEQMLLLEVRASLQLFGGADALREHLQEELAQFHCRTSIALAPTPRAAAWLARSGRQLCIDQPEQLADALSRLPLAVTGFEDRLIEQLRGIGVRRLSDLIRLPRDAFARRYTARALRELDQALGRTADVRCPVPPPRRFFANVDLLHEVHVSERLLYPLQQLLRELDDYLRATQQGVSQLQLRFVHRDGSWTPLPLGFAEATRDAARIGDLMQQRLETVQLAAPVLGIGLRAEELHDLAGRDHALFTSERSDDAWPQLLERLRARMGEAAVQGVAMHADHRPEHAWRLVEPGQARDNRGIRGRPCWLLEVPEALQSIKDQPQIGGPLQFVDGPERIETGWWDGSDIARDYYTACDVHGRRLWICRDVRSGQWWWQGIFQ